MCIGGAPSVPSIPERQPGQLPDGGSTASRTSDMLGRRRALMATIFTSPNGTLGMPSVTGGATGSTTLG